MKLVNIEENGTEEPRTVVVGVKMDAESRELLTWALVKVARPGDTVLALHVIPSTSDVSDPNGSCSSLLSLVKVFDSILAVYDGFCNLKQVDLKLKLCRGSSIKKILIRETNSYEATSLILGINKHRHGIRYTSSTSIAKYCSKKLPKNCAVLAVSNGKIMYQRQATETKSSSKVHNVKYEYLPWIKGYQVKNFDHENTKVHDCSHSDSSKPLKDESVRSLIVRELHEVKPGWPKTSIVQRAMQLPNWYVTTSLVRSDSICDDEKILPLELRSLQEKYSSVCRLFSYEELKNATSNFSSDNLIGRGGSSKVYKGWLSDGKEVAVKLLKQSEDATKEFTSEIEIITALHHKNIISLFGFCFESNNLILVYNFLSRGSLEEILHGKKENKDVLNWAERYKIAVGVAEALDYLHDDCSVQPVIHRDVKSSNILLSDDFEPQLADFGLALWSSSSNQYTTCNDIAGTFGYLAPEYFMYGKVNEKIDVYAFGIVLLELISGRKPVSSQCSTGVESIVIWAKKILQDEEVKQLVDPSLGEKYDDGELERMILAASICIRHAHRSRPRIALVAKLLKGDPDILRWARSQVNSSEEADELDDEALNPNSNSEEADELDDEALNPNSNIQSHINLALLDVEDDTLSVSSVDPSVDFITANTSMEDYLKGRWSRTSSFD